MAICPGCGKENPSGARFCMACATPLAAPRRPREVRKTVTIVFCDMTESTALGERLDTESLRTVMLRYFEEIKGVLERHGATVEKFIGDAVMAVFGIPRVHEDDALRAVRAAVEFREKLPSLNDEFERGFGIRIEVRTGVNTGEVVAGDASAGQAFVTGDTVNVATRLQQAAAPGDIVIGETTYRLVSSAVVAQPLPALPLKGKSETVSARRLVAFAPQAPLHTERLSSPLVGRAEELSLLQDVFRDAIESRRCHAVTVLGLPGVGKSRLLHEFVSAPEDRVRILWGRCLPYGEGITFWPVRDIIRRAATIRDEDDAEKVRDKIEAMLPATDDRRLIAERLAGTLGLAQTSALIQETYWAIRKFLRALAVDGSVVVVFDDIQWGEPAFLDLIEYLVGFTTDSALLLVCIARPDLLDAQGGWGSGPRQTILRLDPLSDTASRILVDNLLSGADLPEDVRSRILEIAEGVPLVVEEIIGALIDEGLIRRIGEAWKTVGDPSGALMPTNLRTLLDARLDRLPEEERGLLQRASVIGRRFWWSSIAELEAEVSPSDVGKVLQALVRKDLIRPDDSGLAGEDAFRFRHLLIRDAAYDSIPKSMRSELHERFADWLEKRRDKRIEEIEEILAYHLEQAFRYREELGPVERPSELALRAAAHLMAAGRRALDRSDAQAAVHLLSRSLELLPEGGENRSEAMLALSEAHVGRGEHRKARELIEEVIARAREDGDRMLETRGRLELIDVRLRGEPSFTATDAVGEIESLIESIDAVDDDRSLGWAWRRLSTGRWIMGQATAAEQAVERALRCAARSHDRGLERSCLQQMTTILLFGPAPADTMLERGRAILETPDIDRLTESYALDVLAMHAAMLGRFEEARVHATRAVGIFRDLGLRFQEALEAEVFGVVEMLAGDPDAAERVLRSSADALIEMGETGGLSTVAAGLAQALYVQGKYDEAERFAILSRNSSSNDDIDSQVGWRRVFAKLLAHRGEQAAAERLAREAVELADRAEFPVLRADTLMDLANVLIAGEREEAARSVEEALRLYEIKGNRVSASRARARLDHITSSSGTT